MTTTVARGATAYGLANLDSESGAARIIYRQSRRAPDDDVVLLHVGEVDCGSLVWRMAESRSTTPHVAIEESRRRYRAFASSLNRPLIVAGVTPPTVMDYTAFEGDSNPRFGLRATWRERLEMSLAWNNAIEAWAAEEGHVFMDVCTDVLDTSSLTVKDSFRPASASDHHLDWHQFGRYLGTTALPRALGQIEVSR